MERAAVGLPFSVLDPLPVTFCSVCVQVKTVHVDAGEPSLWVTALIPTAPGAVQAVLRGVLCEPQPWSLT